MFQSTTNPSNFHIAISKRQLKQCPHFESLNSFFFIFYLSYCDCVLWQIEPYLIFHRTEPAPRHQLIWLQEFLMTFYRTQPPQLDVYFKSMNKTSIAPALFARTHIDSTENLYPSTLLKDTGFLQTRNWIHLAIASTEIWFWFKWRSLLHI